MAAGPELVRWWENANEHAYGQAVITAALDARRVGARAPLTRAYLEAAAPGYLTPRQRADAPPDWLDHALGYATKPLRGATATLCPVSAGMGDITGYLAADYLHQHALRTRRTTHLPDTAWQALVQHHHPDDALRLAANAARRGRDHEAGTLYQQHADNGDIDAAYLLAELLFKQGRVDELAHRADNGDTYAASWLAKLLFERGRVDELTHRADKGDTGAANRLAELLAAQGRIDDALTRFRTLADNGHITAALDLIDLLSEHGRIAELEAEVAAGTSGALDALRSVRSHHPTDTRDRGRHRAGAGQAGRETD